MGVATVVLVGEADLGRVPEFLRLGAVVVVAPDMDALHAWQREQLGVTSVSEAPTPPGHLSLVIDHRGHCIRWAGRRLDLTELEYRVLACLVAEPGRAWSFRELREAGWGPVPDLGDDPYVVRSVVQRLRKKLRAEGAEVTIDPVRGFGLRLAVSGAPPSAAPTVRSAARTVRPQAAVAVPA